MIGIFDSGFGGLTVMKEYLKKYPEYDYMYLGDQANMPYGKLPTDLLKKLVVKNIEFLLKEGCKLIIIACNTASAGALRYMQKIYKGNPTILGVIVPAAEEALKKTRFGNIGIIATQGTVRSGAYAIELDKYMLDLYKPTDKGANKRICVFEQACPLLVPLIENGFTKKMLPNMMLKKYLRPLKEANVDTLILGCTHYTLLQKEIERIMKKNCRIVSSATATVNAIGEYFKRHPDVEKSLSSKGTRTYYTTGAVEHFNKLGSQFLGVKINAKKAVL